MTQEKRFFHSLRWLIGFVFSVILLFLVAISGLLIYQMEKFNTVAREHAESHIPILEVLTTTQLSITRLSSIGVELVASTSGAKSRTLITHANELIAEIAYNLSLLEESKEVYELREILDSVRPGIQLLIDKKQQTFELKERFDADILLVKHLLTGAFVDEANMEEGNLWRQLLLEVSNLQSVGKVYELKRGLGKIHFYLEQLDDIVSPSGVTLLDDVELILAGEDGLESIIKQREILQTELVSLDTQNRILMGSIVDYGQRIYSQREKRVAQQAQELQSSAGLSRNILILAIVAMIVITFASYLVLKRRLFSKLVNLQGIVSSKDSITDEDLLSFDERNEIGSLVYQLKDYLDTIELQKAQLAQTGSQLESMLRYSRLCVAVVKRDKILFHNDMFADLFHISQLTFLSELPHNVAKLAKEPRKLSEGSVVLLSGYHDIVRDKWFDMRAANILWDGENCNFIMFLDVTDREKATQAFERSLSDAEKKAQIDGLTGLYNRNYFDAVMRDLNSESDGVSYAFVVIDIDQFKEYNDAFGHLKGDAVLSKVAETIQYCVSENANAIRYGGEEFVIIIRDADQASTRQLTNQILQRVLELDIAHPASAHKVVTVSAGGAISQVDSNRTPIAYFEEADKKLYQAKAAGRNCSVF
ncbi:diguanylate cyclase [Marinomonas mediterranea]|jgi:diguanylate cyclase (GGDEF) domain|uniref:diguanylate cyclase n=1 Tax=Marinomonas mediterranea (strain ATCC 700492 / JCM 21426 / NBRC 103028 / MMB-1) TaxID=717774 RepID=F2JVX7_MARM1|nr:GGDEF domain-containing protein [Marinomonas mediterranea]ADZ92865.1 diguanylate cyclase [Marinomonas mediterranea MMB-1]WCN14855.1 diguanylate cyclase [Marinomonas mediterranea]WCN18887.1 diguanylate cyclase [Marinomonas mediterranea MMB-1]